MPDAIDRGRRLYELFCESMAAGGESVEPWSSLGPRERLAWADAAAGVVREFEALFGGASC
jgi:hypothetical protein